MDTRSSADRSPRAAARALQLHFLINARRIQRLEWSAGMRVCQRLLVVCLGELDERTGQCHLLEHPEAAVRRFVVRLKRLESFCIIRALGRWNGRTLNGHRLGHPRGRSPEMFRLFS